MFREMRRVKNKVSEENAFNFLEVAKEGVLSTISVDNNYPYSTAVNHVLMDQTIYFHCAKSGHKIDNILSNNKVSFFAVADSNIDQKAYTTKFKSVHVFGTASIVEDKEEFKKALYRIAKKYTGSFFSKAAAEIASAIDQTMVVRIKVDHISGKATKK